MILESNTRKEPQCIWLIYFAKPSGFEKQGEPCDVHLYEKTNLRKICLVQICCKYKLYKAWLQMQMW